MECREVIQTRRTVRRYKSTPIPDEVLRIILEAGLAAPSAVNFQPWYFVAVQSQEAMKRLVEIGGQTALKMEAGLRKRFPNHPEVVEETCSFVRELGGAPVCILVFQMEKEYAKSQSDIYQSIAAAVENMILATWEQGIGSCWLTAPVNAGFGPDIQTAFAPGKGDLVAMVTLGYPAQTPKAPRRKEGRYSIV